MTGWFARRQGSTASAEHEVCQFPQRDSHDRGHSDEERVRGLLADQEGVGHAVRAQPSGREESRGILAATAPQPGAAHELCRCPELHSKHACDDDVASPHRIPSVFLLCRRTPGRGATLTSRRPPMPES